ncbi:MAG TPA: hemerythrin domain-containing protein [Steroidobacteraceae bacterium]|nr:hemerythrin domain-containing protein [Steroidobacteraceae bacterium]
MKQSSSRRKTAAKSKTSSRGRSSSGRRATTSRSRSASRRTPQDAIALLKADHREVDVLVQQFERTRSDRKEAIARRICNALTVHARIEEELLYPAARNVLDRDDTDIVDEADVEHATIKQLVTDVESSSPSDALYDAKVKVISEYVKHHVKEEERELFPKLRRSGLDLQALGTQLAERKQALIQEMEMQGRA